MLQVHHIVERSKGGTDDPDNLIATCLTCHSDVHTKRPFTQRFSVEELKQHRDSVYRLVADAKLVPPEDDYGRITASPRHTALADSHQDASVESLVIADGKLIQPVLPQESVAILLAAAESPDGQVVVINLSHDFIVEIDHRQMNSNADPRDRARYRNAVEKLVEHGLLDPYSDNILNLTNRGYLLGDQLLALRHASNRGG